MSSRIRPLGTQYGHRNPVTNRMPTRRASKPIVEALEGRALMAATLMWLGPPPVGTFTPGAININDQIAGMSSVQVNGVASYTWSPSGEYTRDVNLDFSRFSYALYDID